jgi:membrane-associated phospholipid phosphatase
MFNFNELWDYVRVPGTVQKFERVGDLLQYVVPWVAIALVAFIGTPALAWAWLYTCGATVIIVSVLKYALNSTWLGTRPNGGEHSFPSGHTSGAFSGAWFILYAFGPVAAAIPLVAAVITGLSRVAAKKHWWRDVLTGATIALAVTHVVFL